MHTGRGMVSKTRALLDVGMQQPGPPSLQMLGDGIADGLLRKLCASCHLGQANLAVGVDPVRDRGGGCLACHLQREADGGHVQLSAAVGDAHCFGCHSRSGRIALNYAGLAEVDAVTAQRHADTLARLPDGRLVRRLHADVHQRAGMACIDCHTGAGLMGFLAQHRSGTADIRCSDCHANRNPRVTAADWPQAEAGLLRRIPFSLGPGQAFLTTAQGTPLWHLQLVGEQVLLYPKLGGEPIEVPQAPAQHVPLAEQHRRLECDTCHAQWVPQCLGCHVEFREDGRQWDHVEQAFTPGAWLERRWDADAGPPVLGMKDEQTVGVFVPGMIMTLHHPDLPEPRFLRHFAALAPHTSGPARDCADCHLSSAALGLGNGRLQLEAGELVFSAQRSPLQDGLPGDAWTGLGEAQVLHGRSYPRPLSAQQIRRIFQALPSSPAAD